MRVWSGAIALGLLMGLPAGAIAMELRDAQDNLEIAQVLDSREEKRQAALRWLRQGVQQFRASRFQDALQSFETALALVRDIGDRAWEGIILNNIGSIYDTQSQYPQALDFYQ